MNNLYRIHPQPAFNFGGLVIDNFAGGGGASTGIELALGRPVDIAVNHDPEAVAMHDINHPHTASGKRLSKSAQVRMCGNSVCPPVAAALVRANLVEQQQSEVAA